MVDRDDAHHARCAAALEALPVGGLLTTWACFTEAMFLLSRELGWRGQDELWGYLADGLLRLHSPSDDEWKRMRGLMHDYADAPMDLGDASLVAAAETLRQRRIFTVDRHFRFYRQRQGHAFEVVP